MLRSPLGRARGLGAAHAGTAEWWGHTLSSIALVPLTLWFICAMVRMEGASRDDLAAWLSHPVPLVLMLVTLVTTFYHMRHGLEGVINDYIHQPVAHLCMLLAVKTVTVLLCLACIISVLRLGL